MDSDLDGPSPQFTLTCISTGGPATTVTWTRDSVTVTEGTESVLTDPVTSQYTHTLTGRLGGLYTCTATNNKPSNDSAELLVVQVTAPSVSATADIVAGGTVSLTCDYALSQSVDVTVSVTWMVNGSEVDNSTYDDVTNNGDRITFSPVTTSDTGRYTCTLFITARHTALVKRLGPVQSAEKEIIIQSIRLTVYYTILYVCYCMYFLPPVPQPGVVITLSHTPPLCAGTSLTLTCTVTLDPNVNNNERVLTEWNGPRHIAGDRYSVTPAMRESDSSYSSSLVISPLTDQDDGMYTCTAKVTGGANVQSATAHGAVTITVMGKYVTYAMEAH